MEGRGFEEVRIMVCLQRSVKPGSNLWEGDRKGGWAAHMALVRVQARNDEEA